jgi:AraC-like DNA-binding protein
MSPRSTNPDDFQDLPRPLAVMARDVPDHQVTHWHSHKRAQLVYAASGVMVVRTRKGTWVIPPQRAVWVPAGVQHETQTVGVVAMRTLYIRVSAAKRLPKECLAVSVSPLLRELIVRAASLPVLYSRRKPVARIMEMILDEIRESPMVPLHLPIPANSRVSSICSAIAANPRCHETLEQLARREGMSKRTAERLYIRDVGMTFAQWRQQARLLSGLSRLAIGKSVKQAAFEAGYASQSAFTNLFKRTFGNTPRGYFS